MTENEELVIYREFINNLYIYSIFNSDAESVRGLVENANRLARAQGMSDSTEESDALILERLRNLSLI